MGIWTTIENGKSTDFVTSFKSRHVSGAEISMAISEGNNDLDRYIFDKTKSIFLRTVVTQSNYDRIATDIRNAKWAPKMEK